MPTSPVYPTVSIAAEKNLNAPEESDLANLRIQKQSILGANSLCSYADMMRAGADALADNDDSSMKKALQARISYFL